MGEQTDFEFFFYNFRPIMVDDVSLLLVNILKVSLEKFLILYLLISCFSVKQTEK